jgi:hypothetical protein
MHPNRNTQVIHEQKKTESSCKSDTYRAFGCFIAFRVVSSKNIVQKFDHQKAHWASCSVDAPDFAITARINAICAALPRSIFSVKGGTRTQGAVNFTYFEHIPFVELHIRPFNEIPSTGLKLPSIGSDGTSLLFENAIKAHTTIL